ncbi:MAG: metal ABC transporter substrate-binding protein [Nostocoides sp.]
MLMHSRVRAVLTFTVVLGATTLAGCSSGTDTSIPSPGDTITVDASFYPLEYLVTRIGGEHVNVSTLTKPGAEPHDLELAPAQVTDMTKATLVVYESGLQPSVDAAVAQVAKDHSFDVVPAADLTLHREPEASGHAPTDDGDANPEMDPHFWLDPVRYSAVATAIGAKLAEVDPDHAADYAANTDKVTNDLAELHKAYVEGLGNCATTQLVTGHAAFGYLAERYGFNPVAINGVSPDVEPNAADMKAIVDLVRTGNVTTVYAETLVSPALAEQIGKETGAAVKVLDPIEAITDQSSGKDYLEVMRSNLATLETGQRCS